MKVYPVLPLHGCLACRPPCLNVVRVDPGNVVHKVLGMVDLLVNVSRSHQPIVTLPLIAPHAAARQDDMLNNWQQVVLSRIKSIKTGRITSFTNTVPKLF